MNQTNQELLKTALHDLHVELGAKMVPFAGYSMPVQYPLGIVKEHKHTRENAGLFDVSHMGQLRISGEKAAAALESLMHLWRHRTSTALTLAGVLPGVRALAARQMDEIADCAKQDWSIEGAVQC